MDYNKSSIGGWLALLLTTLVIRAIAYSKDALQAIQLMAGHNLPSIFSWVVFTEVVAALAVMLSIVYLINRDHRFRKTFMASIVLYAIMLIMMVAASVSHELDTETYIAAIFGLGIYTAIWAPYVYKSERLSNRLDIKEVVAEVVI